MSFMFPLPTTERVFLSIGLVLFFSMLFVPTTYQPVKAVLLAVLLSAIVIGAIQGKIDFKLHRSVLFWSVTIIITGGFFMLVGVLNGAPGALRVGTVYLLWPVVYTILIGSIVSEMNIHKLLAVLVYAGIALGLYGAMYFAHVLGWLPTALYIELDQGQVDGLYDGMVEYNMYSIASLLFLVPFLFVAILHCSRVDPPILVRRWLWLALALCLALVILSGRRALWLVVLLSPVIYWALSLFSTPVRNRRSRREGLRKAVQIFFVSVAVFLLLKIVFGLDLTVMTGAMISSVGALEESALIRYLQAEALFSGWLESPWIGHGHGAVAQGVIRDESMPWAYELSYLALLFHTGLLGMLIYAGCIGWVYWQGVKVLRVSERYGRLMMPVLVGTTCFLIGNATNPYLTKFDFMWVLFLPLAIINRHLIERNAMKTKQ